MHTARTPPPRLSPALSYEHDTDAVNLLVAVGCLIGMAMLYGLYDWLTAAPPVAF